MNSINLITDCGWSIAGTVGGLFAGSAANLLKSGSLFTHDNTACAAPFDRLFPLDIINNLRESDYKTIKSRGVMTPTPFNLLYPGIHVAASLGCIVLNTIGEVRSGKDNLVDLGKKIGGRVATGVIYPTLHSSMLFLGSILAKIYIRPILAQYGIDVSGHAWYQISLAIHSANCLQEVLVNGTPKQKKAYLALVGAVAMSDAVWSYNSAANCHSVADIVSGVALVTLAHVGLSVTENLISRELKSFKGWMWPNKNKKPEK